MVYKTGHIMALNANQATASLEGVPVASILNLKRGTPFAG
jgi:hypothetical protein